MLYILASHTLVVPADALLQGDADEHQESCIYGAVDDELESSSELCTCCIPVQGADSCLLLLCRRVMQM